MYSQRNYLSPDLKIVFKFTDELGRSTDTRK